MTACIVGWAHSPFGKLAGETLESLIVKVAGEALVEVAPQLVEVGRPLVAAAPAAAAAAPLRIVK